MKKRCSIQLICFILIFLLQSANIEAFAGTTVNVTSLSLSKASDVLTVGQTDTLKATVLPENATNKNVTWLSTNTNVVEVYNGVLMAIGEGTALVTAFTEDGGKSATCIVIVKKPVSTIQLNKATDTLNVGSIDTLIATVSPAQAITWTSSDSSIVQVFNGVLMAKSVGTAIISATAADGSSTATCKVAVVNTPSTVTLNKASDIIAVGGKDTLAATVTPALPANTYLIWMSSNPNVVSVSGGFITGEALGQAVITVIASDGSCSATCEVTVSNEPVNNTKVTRLGGNDRLETSVTISKAGWPSGSAYAVLVTGNDYPDALSAAPLAKRYNAPILLTDTDSISSGTLNEIKRLNATYIFICGGTGVVSQGIENQLKSLGIKTERLFGSDRYGTSAAIAQKLGVSSGEIIVANGYDWPDALSAAAIAAKCGIPIILTSQSELPDSVYSFIKIRSFSKAYILGDIDLISNTVANRFTNPDRIPGNTIYERNINIIKKFQSYLDISNICVATGKDFPDALSGSAYAAGLSSPIVLINDSNVQSATTQYVSEYLSKIENVYVFGLQGAVSDDAISKMFSK